MKSFNLNLDNLVSVCTYGCSVMIYVQIGAVGETYKQETNIFKCICFNHALNLTISKSCSVSGVRNSIGNFTEIISFSKCSAKIMFILRKICGHEIKNLCETRWSERKESLAELEQ